METSVDVVVIGAGPGGMAAALAASEAGATVLLLDENPQAGGQIYRQLPESFRKRGGVVAQAKDHAAGKALIQRVQAAPIRFVRGANVWGVFDGTRVAYTDANGAHEVLAQRLVLATGAFDRPVAFPGWTLPGVMTAGGLQNLLKSQAVLPGSRVAVVGSGPLILVVARQLLAAGADVVVVAEAAPYLARWRSALVMLSEVGLMLEGLRYILALRRAGVPYLTNHGIVRATGDEAVRSVTTANLDRQGRPKPGSDRTWDADVVCVGYGFLSSIELAVQAGARTYYDEGFDAWVPERDADMRTSVPRLFAVGDGAGVAGSVVAELEGTIAGHAAAADLGMTASPAGSREHAQARSRLARLTRFRRGIDALYRFRSGLLDSIDAQTIVCRCEEVTAEQVSAALAHGANHLNEVKGWTRCGMGLCQGRLCHSTLTHLVARATGQPTDQVGPYTVRPPAKPVPISALVEGVTID
jgi:NADPH-dependent 2,4-dienoyl-CoA reductase/sulfur reductase-like enzyme